VIRALLAERDREKLGADQLHIEKPRLAQELARAFRVISASGRPRSGFPDIAGDAANVILGIAPLRTARAARR
jgi:hypothetical protein